MNLLQIFAYMYVYEDLVVFSNIFLIYNLARILTQFSTITFNGNLVVQSLHDVRFFTSPGTIAFFPKMILSVTNQSQSNINPNYRTTGGHEHNRKAVVICLIGITWPSILFDRGDASFPQV